MRHLLYIALGLMVFMASCKHDNIEPTLGPDITSLGIICPDETFEVNSFTNSATTVDFTLSSVTISADFSENVNWELFVVGDNKAKYSESGFGKTINVSWDGGSKNGILFRSGDSASVKLKISCLDTIFGNNIYITQEKSYLYTIVDDFDGNTSITNWSNASGDLIGLNIAATDSGAAQESAYMYMEGVDVGKGSYLGQAMQQPSTLNFGLTTTSDQLYLNAMVRGSSNSIVEFRIYENDGDWYFYQVPITWTGWKVISMNYNDFATGSGGLDKVPSDLKQVRITLRSDNPSPSAVANIDFLNFTEGGPFVP